MSPLARPPRSILGRFDPVTDPRCTDCWYGLAGTGPDRACPECGASVGGAFVAPPLGQFTATDLRRMRASIRGIAVAALLLATLPLWGRWLMIDRGTTVLVIWGLAILGCLAAWMLGRVSAGPMQNGRSDDDLQASAAPLRTVALVCLLPITFPLLVLPGLVVLHTHAMALARRTADATLDVRLGDAALVAALIVCAGPLLIPLSPIAGQLWLAGAVIATLRLMHRWFELDGHLGVAACWAETEDRRRGTSADPA